MRAHRLLHAFYRHRVPGRFARSSWLRELPNKALQRTNLSSRLRAVFRRMSETSGCAIRACRSKVGPAAIIPVANAALIVCRAIEALACTMPVERAAPAGVHIHGLAADRWHVQHGGDDRGLLASELGDVVPRVLDALARGADPLTL